jgi:hypothetical protein
LPPVSVAITALANVPPLPPCKLMLVGALLCPMLIAFVAVVRAAVLVMIWA